MHFSINLPAGKRKYLFGLILLLFTSVISVAFSMGGNDDFEAATREVLLRRIGDKLLSQSGDLTSRVLPVKQIAANDYQIRFENEFSFLPDSLVKTTQLLLARDPLTRDYVVNVFNGGDSGVTYSYAIFKNEKNDIVPCRGRKQLKALYIIDIKFKPTGLNTTKNMCLLGSLPFLAFVGLIFLRSDKQSRDLPNGGFIDMLTLGAVLFDAKNRKLIINGTTTDLTGTETRLLHIFALSPNETIDRSRLQKEIWEDEGVIVGRSLDMFISKLRKKLEPDPTVKIVVIRGKGYKLEINS